MSWASFQQLYPTRPHSFLTLICCEPNHVLLLLDVLVCLTIVQSLCHIGSPPCLHPIGPMLTPTPTQFIYIFIHPPRTLQCCPDMLLSTPLSYFYFDPADKPCTLSPVPLLPASDIGVMSAAYVDALIKAKLEPRIGYDHLDTGMMTLCQEPSSPTICLFCHLLSSCVINIISFRRNNGMTIKH